MNKNDLQKIEDMLKHQIGVVAEGINHKLDLVIEGHQLLAQKIDATRSELKEDINNVDRRLMTAEARLDKEFTRPIPGNYYTIGRIIIKKDWLVETDE
ncbi:MAG: hypothetical protein NTZ51_00285 [Proteobacteria bacterium]|nr:hypothetical protein [Pseudomonadota bacterium]